jgi:hypothetical protein
MSSELSKIRDLMTGNLTSVAMNEPLEPDDPRLARARAKHRTADIERPRDVTVTGNNVPSCSRPYMNDQSRTAPVDSQGHDDEPGEKYQALLIGPTLTARQRRGVFGQAPGG